MCAVTLEMASESKKRSRSPSPDPTPHICAICTDVVDEDDEDALSLPCSAAQGCKSHFHGACIRLWLKYRRTCPLCVRAVSLIGSTHPCSTHPCQT